MLKNRTYIPIMPPDLELPLSRTYFHGPKGARAIEVLLYRLSQRRGVARLSQLQHAHVFLRILGDFRKSQGNCKVATRHPHN